MSAEKETVRDQVRNTLNLVNAGSSASQSSGSQSSDSKEAAEMSTESDAEARTKIDWLFSSVQALSVEQVEAVLNKNPEFIFKKAAKSPDTILEFMLDADIRWKTPEGFEKAEKIVKLISNAYTHMLVESSLTEAQIHSFHRFNQVMAERISNFKLQMLKLVAEHDATLTKIAKSIYFEPFCYDYPINRPLFVRSLQKNCNMFSLTVNYSEAFGDLVQILKVNTSLIRIVIGERCIWSGKALQEFISALNHSKVKELCFIGSMNEECLKMFLQCQKLEKIEFLDLSMKDQDEGHAWNPELSSALLENTTLKVLDISLSSGLPEFLNCVSNQRSLISITCRKRNYNKQNDTCELAAIRNVIINNSRLTFLKLDFTIDYPDKAKALETIYSSLTRNESLTYFGFDPFLNSSPVDKAWSERVVEGLSNVLKDNYTLTSVSVKTHPGLYDNISFYVSPATGFLLASKLGLERNHSSLNEIHRQFERNEKINKMMQYINEAVENYKRKQFSEAHRKILQAFDESKPFMETWLNVSNLLSDHVLDAPFILGKVLARKFPNFLFYACHAFSAIKPDNPYYAQAKFELSIIIRNGVDVKATLENYSEGSDEGICLEEEANMTDKVVKRIYRDERSSLIALQQEYENSSEAHLEQAITALPHLLEIQNVDQKGIAEKLEVGQEIKSLAEFYVNNGWEHSETEPKIEVGEIGENPATIIHLLSLIKRQKDQYEALTKQLNQAKAANSAQQGEGEHAGMELQSPKKANSSKVAVSPKPARTASEEGAEKEAHGKKRDRTEMEERSGKDEKRSEGSGSSGSAPGTDAGNGSGASNSSDASSDEREGPAFKKRKVAL